MPEQGLLEGLAAIVTGGASGIGRATAGLLAQHGARVAVFDVQETAGREVADSLNGSGCFQRCDVRDEAEVARAFKAVLDHYGQLDVLVNVVGGSGAEGGPQPAYIWEMAASEWDGMLAMNLRSTFLCCREAAQHMMSRKTGTIVNVSSSRGIFPVPRQSHYSAAKAGVIALTNAIALELAPYGIRVNSVAPGLTDTPRVRRDFPGERWDQFMAQQPLGRVAAPEDIGQAIVFLAGPLSRHVTGQVLRVDGGLST